MHQCRNCRNFCAAADKRPFGLEEVAFHCPVTGEHRLSQSWIACETFTPANAKHDRDTPPASLRPEKA